VCHLIFVKSSHRAVPLNVRIKDGERGCQGAEVTVLKGEKPLVHLAHDLHVLPETSLLRQPHGFEGLGGIRVHFHPRQLAVADGPDLAEGHIHL
jgi:hypothetical protein